ncbi:MAG TPA: hypothetical protein VGG85_00220 [Terracidiphilus sp.]|jgi:hypothetical protein
MNLTVGTRRSQKAGKITLAIGIVSIVLFVGLEVNSYLLGF